MHRPSLRSPAATGGVAPITPGALPISDAIARSAPLASLRQRLSDSTARFDAIRDVLPVALQAHVQPGPLDDESWSLLAANAAVAAKLRHLQPLVETSLQQHGWPPRTLRVKVVGR
jgi:hypothetical protein